MRICAGTSQTDQETEEEVVLLSADFHNCIDSSDKYDSRNDQMQSDGERWQSGGTFLW